MNNNPTPQAVVLVATDCHGSLQIATYSYRLLSDGAME